MGLLDRFNTDEIMSRIEKTKNDLFMSTDNSNSPIQKQNMNFCTNCGTKLNSNEKFCHNCGSAVSLTNPYEPESVSHEYESIQQETKDNSTQEPKESSENIDKDNDYNGDTENRKNIYEGTLHKCPNCGEILKSFTSVCPLCGHEIRDAQSSNSIMELSRKLEEIEARQMPQFQAKRSIMKTFVGKDFNNTDEEREARKKFENQKEQQKSNLIINFPIPNTREDILELMILSASNINIEKGIDDDVSKAWLQKMEQVYEKAKITMGTSAEFAQIKNIYDRKKGELKNRKFKSFFFVSYCVSGFLLFECFCMFMAKNTKAGVILLLIAIGVLLLGIKFTSIYIKNNNKI